MMILKEEAGNDQAYASNQRENTRHSQPRDRDYDDDDDDRHRRGGYDNGHQKKSKMSRMMEIFDF